MSAVTSPDGFQTTVVRMPAPGVPGDFAGANIKANVIGGPGAWVASPAGVLIGAMAYANPATGFATNYFQPSSFVGFVHREGQAIITPFLGFNGQSIPSGDMVTVMNFGEFWGLFGGGASVGQKVYANPVSGALSGAATGASVSATGGAGTVANGVLTLTTAPTSGTYAAGQIVSMAGLPAGTYAVSTTGSAIGDTITLANADGAAIPAVGTATSFTAYGIQETPFTVLQNVPAAASFTASLAPPASGAAFGVLTVTAIASGTLADGQWINAPGLPSTANVEILDQLSGTPGGAGTYLTTNTFYTIASTASFAAVTGQVGKISSIVTAAN